ncbi:protein-L-isoaspartate(D-aspartate) O-methyltransferase [Halocalculus aciditolerans]|uniref:Protein-L-isoaspartate O-methyltransferase n=1 Tax=Halocalculus aciditolerans TaxID=1383812 RepID=A0A830FM57_9EURY|nr:protein-L-isoaspartate(D-aspartate) O-methyltransferase [Halocalculus aciditolerans]GGL69484.1 protein-L-isoaspartate O-methyltransferase [Halocalculus aciditolerans]
MSGYDEERDRLASVVERRGVSERVVDAIRAVPRHEFVPESEADAAYRDRPVPIGDEQTCSAPSMVATMCDRLDLDEGEDVLEVGTGCGYHAAVTAELVGSAHVYSVEYLEDLAADARENLNETGYGGVSVRVGDGREGWEAHAPYDAAYLTCAAPDFPAPLVEQVREGGRLLGPLGDLGQRLVYAEKEDGGLERETGVSVRFVRIQGGGESGE